MGGFTWWRAVKAQAALLVSGYSSTKHRIGRGRLLGRWMIAAEMPDGRYLCHSERDIADCLEEAAIARGATS